MKKFKLGISFFVLVFICILTKQFFILINYFLALFLHEMAHLFVAIKRGYNLKLFKLDILGMQIELDSEVESKDVFAINIAGPLFNLFICLVCMAIYWLVPNSFNYLNCFCISNLIISLFNLLPIYPLDGGKIFRGIVKSDKLYKRLDLGFRLINFAIFAGLFIWSSLHVINWFFFIIAVFFLISTPSNKITFSIFKSNKAKNFEHIILLKVNETDNLYSLIKHISKARYTIFYLNQNKPVYIDEDKVIKLSLSLPLNTKLSDIKF